MAAKGALLRSLGALWEAIGRQRRTFEDQVAPKGAHLEHPGAHLEPSGAHLEYFWLNLGRSGPESGPNGAKVAFWSIIFTILMKYGAEFPKSEQRPFLVGI